MDPGCDTSYVRMVAVPSAIELERRSGTAEENAVFSNETRTQEGLGNGGIAVDIDGDGPQRSNDQLAPIESGFDNGVENRVQNTSEGRCHSGSKLSFCSASVAIKLTLFVGILVTVASGVMAIVFWCAFYQTLYSTAPWSFRRAQVSAPARNIGCTFAVSPLLVWRVLEAGVEVHSLP
jgi:hypothetical protein